MRSSSMSPTQIPRPKSLNSAKTISESSQAAVPSKTYTLNNVPRPSSKSLASLSPEFAAKSESVESKTEKSETKMASSAYQQRVAVPRKGDPEVSSENAASSSTVPAVAPASESMRIKLPTPPRTAEEYYARAKAHSSKPSLPKPETRAQAAPTAVTSAKGETSAKSSVSAGKPRTVAEPVDSQSAPAGKSSNKYSQPVIVPRKSAPAVEASTSSNPLPASESMRIKLPPAPKTSEEYYGRMGSRTHAQGSGLDALPSQQSQKSEPIKPKSQNLPSLSSRYGSAIISETKAAPSSESQKKLGQAPSGVKSTVPPESNNKNFAKQENVPLNAQQAIAEVTEVANDVVSAFGSSRAIHININAPIEIHIHQAKPSKL